MVKSQLKQLKTALKEAGIPTSNRRTKKKKNRKNLIDRTSILENIRSQFNHYEKKINRVKHDVGGRKLRGIEGRPMKSYQAGEEKRKKTILVDMLRRNKEGGIIDRRFGEHNTHLSLEEKMLRRYAVEKQKLHKKSNIYNLEEDDDLGYFGESFEEIEDFNVINVDDENNYGNIDFETVKDMHFGGFENSEQDKKKTKSEVMKEIIAKSKIRKYERQKIKDDDEIEREMIDAELNNLRSLLSRNDNFIELETKEKQSNKDIQYDLSVKELSYEKRAYPSARTKTEEEIAQEKAEELQKLEEERLKRMKYEDFSENENIENSGIFFSEEDNLEDDFINDDNNQTDNDTEFYSFEKETPEKYEYEKTNGIPHNVNNIENSSNLDKRETIGNLTCDNIVHKSEDTAFESFDKFYNFDSEKKKKSIAYVYPCPSSILEFLSILKNINQEDIPKVVNRIKILYHPSLHPLNKEKLQSFIVVLLDLILYLSEKKRASLSTLDMLSEHLRDLSTKYPEMAYNAFHKKLKSFREKLNQLLSSKKEDKLSILIQDLVLLRLIGVIFPTSDLSHVIVTPTLLIMGQLLSQLEIVSLGDICLKLYLITLFAEYINLSQRVVPEVIHALLNIIKILFQKNKKKLDKKNKSINSENKFFDLLCEPRILKISDIYSNDDKNKELEVSLFKTTAQLIDNYANLWNGKPAFIEIFSPCLNLLKLFSSKILLSPKLQMEIDSINQRIAKLLHFSFQSRKPLMLQAHKPIPIPSFIPKFEDEYSLDRKSYDPDRERAESTKLKFQYRDNKRSAIRMLRRDAQFIARETKKIQKEKDIKYAAKMKKIHGQLTQEN
ncbi:hypothetical protein PMAC_000931 [Pneumocystis sp. 'macacae']|nr:hypothetical protein PMAC_000931 [Pneumocystis sp. 'macacae']